VAAPFREAEFDIMYNQGISREGDIIDLAVTHEVVAKSGAWFEYKGQKIAQGREAAKQYLHDNPKVLDEIAKQTTAAAAKEV
jgi:recombination protein RecA